MKNHEEFRKAVFEKAAAYEKKRKLKRQRALRIAVSACTCMVFALIIALVPIKTLISDRKTVVEYTTTNMETYSSDAESSTVEMTPTSTTATTSETMATTTEILTTATTATTATYATNATTISVTTTTKEATIASTTTTEAATTTTSSTTVPAEKDFYYYNGALTLEGSQNYGICYEPKLTKAYIITSPDTLSVKEKEYFNENFFETSSLVCVIMETENQLVVPKLAGAQFAENGVNVFIDVPENENPKYISGAKWIILIPAPNTLVSAATAITVEFSR